MANIASIKVRKTNTVYGIQDAAASLAIEQMKNGTDIDSFGDVETALATKVDKVTGKGLSTNDYDNTAKGIVDNIQSNVIANTKLIKDTVGWSGKNKWNIKDSSIAYDASSGLTYTVLERGYQVTNSTAAEWASLKMITASNLKANTDYKLSTDITITSGTARIIVSGATSQGGTYTNVVDSGNITANGKAEVTFNTGSYTWFRFTIYSTVGSSVTGNVKYDDFMIRSADILDSTYEPYFGSTAFPRSEQAVLGAKNLFDIESANSFSNAKVENKSIVNTDTDSRAANFWVGIRKGTTPVQTLLTLQTLSAVGEYEFKITIPSNANYDNLYIGHNGVNHDMKVGIPFSGYGDYIISFNATGVDSSTVGGYVLTKVMLRLASDPDDTYAPYAMTNKELTNAVNGITVKSYTTEQFTVNAGQYSPQEISIANGDLIPLGIVGYRIDGNGNTECGMWKNWMDISTKKVLFGVKNFSASATATVTVTIFVLYKG